MKIKQFVKGLFYSNIQYISNEFEKRKVNTQKNHDYRHLYKIVHEKANPCFVLSTGRCGTALLTKIFKQHQGINVFHTPIPELVYYSKYAYENNEKLFKEIKYIVDAARYDQIKKSFLLNKIFIETNNRITFFANQLAELYPNAKFIHLIRNPINFIKSGIARNWYSGKNPHDEGHIILNENVDIWNRYSQAEKIAWLWNETNLFVENFKLQIDIKRIHTIFAEDLFSNHEKTFNIFDFLNLTQISDFKVESLIKNPVNKSNQKTLKAITFPLNSNLRKILSLADNYNY